MEEKHSHTIPIGMQNDKILMERNLIISNKTANTFTFQTIDPISGFFFYPEVIPQQYEAIHCYIVCNLKIQEPTPKKVNELTDTNMHWNFKQQWKRIRRLSMNWQAVVFISVQKCIYSVLPLSKKESRKQKRTYLFWKNYRKDKIESNEMSYLQRG